jgi:hypothetical protein
MSYQFHVRERVRQAPATLGALLGRWAIKKDFPVMRIAQATGATRATVYSWFSGHDVSNAYKPAVKSLIEILKAAPDSEAAWSTACKTFPHLQR